MAAINDLINQIQDPALRERIQKEVNKLAKQKKFGLVFEEHMPECTPLYDMPIKAGTTVAKRAGSVNDIYKVLRIKDGMAACVHKESQETYAIDVAELVAVAEFGESIYPYLKPIDTVCNAPDSDLWHTLIEADNYHALQLLEYLYAGMVDCIYIDPPYNTGARDWKYNNDYVDSNDVYRHSKWLSFMQKRLRIAKKLLNPDTGVLVVAIDDNELNTIGLLLQEEFPSYAQFCITIVHNPNGNQGKNFGVTNEFAYFMLPSGNQILSLEKRDDTPDIRPLRDVSGNSNMRTDAKNCFYPILVKDGSIVGFGPVCNDEFHPTSANVVRDDGLMEIYPIDASGNERKWVFARHTVETILDELHVEWNNSRKIYDVIRHKTRFTYKTVWNKKEYNANSYGSKLINKLFGDKRFDYPKSLYTVEECVRAVCGNRPNALIVDFFAGSGTTLHAVNLLNAEDGGNRRCIMITNNEVSEKEAKQLQAKGSRPGDDSWNNLGIARYVTWPRTVCSIKGCDIKGAPLKGEYAGSNIPMQDGFEANAAFFQLSFLDKTAVALGMTFNEMLPTLWMKAGAVGPCPTVTGTSKPNMLILPENRLAVLVNENAFSAFAEELSKHPEIQTVFLATDYDINYRSMVKNLRVKSTYQLYRDYLDHFRLNRGRG